MQSIAYYNGEFAPLEELKIPALDRAVYFGDGVYEVMYCRNKTPFAMREHFLRLQASMELLRITPPMQIEAMEALVHEALRQVEGDQHNVYLQISRGTYMRKHFFPPADISANVLLFVTPMQLREIKDPICMCTMHDDRWLHCNIKSLNLIPNVLAAQHAVDMGCTETILYRDGYVTESASSNLFIVQDGVLRTAPLSEFLLAGVTREHVISLAQEFAIPVREEAFTLEELFAADEIIMASTSTHCAYAGEIDGKKVGGRAPEIVWKLQQGYRSKMLRETEN